MGKVARRLGVFFIGIPAVAALIVFLPHHNHLALNLLVTVLSSLGAVEFAGMLKIKGFFVRVPEAAVLGSLSPLAMTFIVSFGADGEITRSLFIIGASWLLISGIFCRRDDFSLVLSRLAAGFSVMIYPGLLLSWIITMSTLEHSTIVLLAFILTVMVNDSLAWTAGKLFGKNNRGLFPASPNKSLAGFAGGLASSVLVCVLLALLIPGAFRPDQIPALPSGVLLGLLSGLAVALGDLAESAIKRGCGLKDSGALIPGRGGVLDSTDSVALSAPVFYVLYRFFF
ncbi:MAG: phosphatidate cytidylyltransferase [Treponema sp.]|jgi:phosphatidate cytidylyltransferase|nr:phosphatidate cytidylyltransferase [Treponema sp.]